MDVNGAVEQMSNIASTYLGMDDYENAILTVKQAEAFIQNNGYTKNIIRVYFTGGRAYLLSGQHADALIYFRRTIQQITAENDSSFDNFKDMANEAIDVLEKLFSVPPQKEDQPEFEQSINECGRLHNIGEYNQCHKMLDELQRRPGLTELERGQIEGTRANAYQNAGNYPDSIKHYKRAIKYFKNSQYLRLTAIHHLAVSLSRIGRDAEAIDILRDALKESNLPTELRFTLLQGLANRLIKNAAPEEKHFAEIKAMLDECIKITETLNEENGVAHITMMNLYIAYEDKESARNHYNIAKEKLIKANSKHLNALTDNEALIQYIEKP